MLKNCCFELKTAVFKQSLKINKLTLPITSTIQTAKPPTTSLPVMEQFYTIQGEGMYQGKAGWFIRLAGCDVGCHWCDVKESWDAGKHEILAVEAIVKEAAACPSDLVVITGGEPLIYDLNHLCKLLKAQGKQLHIETSGAYPLSGQWDWICLSPKKFKFPLPDIYPAVNELKVVVYNKSDFKWAEQHAALVSPDCHLLLQPEWSQSDKMLPLIIDYVQQNPKWRVTLQTHKFMDVR